MIVTIQAVSTVKFAHLFMVLSVVERKSSSCNVKSVKILEETLSSFKFDAIFRNGMFVVFVRFWNGA